RVSGFVLANPESEKDRRFSRRPSRASQSIPLKSRLNSPAETNLRILAPTKSYEYYFRTITNCLLAAFMLTFVVFRSRRQTGREAKDEINRYTSSTEGAASSRALNHFPEINRYKIPSFRTLPPLATRRCTRQTLSRFNS